MPVTFSARGPIALPSGIIPATTWNPADRNVNIGLSPDNLTATDPNSIGNSCWVRSVMPALTGQKVYYECVVNNMGTGGQGFYVGFLRSTSALLGGVDFVAVVFSASQLHYDSPTSADDGGLFSTSNPVVTDVICMAYDDGAKLFWARLNGGIWNNNGSANPVTGTGGYAVSLSGTMHAAFAGFGAAGTTQGTARFATASWGFTAPGAAGPGLPGTFTQINA